jgi:hypothetical protein
LKSNEFNELAPGTTSTVVAFTRSGDTNPALTAARFILTPAAIAGWFATGDHAVDNSRRASHTLVHLKGAESAIRHACTAFHANIPVNDECFSPVYCENTMRTDFGTSAAARAFVWKQLKS